MPKDLKHLTITEIDSLIKRYYAGESVTKLLKEYHLTIRTTELYKLFPPEICENDTCKYCGESLVRDRLSKSASSWMRSNADIYCPVCRHRPYARSCQCFNCIENERQLRDYQRQRIKEVYSRKREPVNFDDISFEQKVFLGALCRSLCKENLLEIKPYIGADVTLAPTDEILNEMYNQLFMAGVIAVSPTSTIEAFVVDDKEFPNRFYTYKVTYFLNLAFPDAKQELFTAILDPDYYSDEYKDTALLLWRKIAVGECLQYLNYQLRRVGFDFTPGEKTYKTFEILLNDFSVSQIYGIIWKAVADASKLYLERSITKKHAANSVIGGCERLGARAKVNGWNMTEYSRIKDLPQSELSAFFFNRVLGIGDKGFKVPPTTV